MRLIESSQALERNVGELNFSNEIDLASSLEGREMGFQLSSRDRNELKLIDEALIRMKEGTYGKCGSCEKKIGVKRLQILPLTALCIECQESLES
jgi:DnaK suppressor protein